MSVRNMRDGDVDQALAMINAEGWGYTRAEIERMLQLDPDGSFIFEDGGILGLVTSITYGRTGVIGHLVVSEKARRRRIGQTLVKSAVDYCEGERAESVLLYATQAGLPLYSKLGFQERGHAVCTRAVLTEEDHGPDENPCSMLKDDDMDDVLAMDERLFGDDRRKLLRKLHEEQPHHSWKLERGGRLSGFIFGRTTSVGFDTGPWECISGPKDAELLLRAMLRSLGHGAVYLAVFESNPEALGMLRSLRPLGTWRTAFMVRGTDRYPHPEGAFGISSFELG